MTAMGIVIKSSRDGFRRAGLVHRRAGTFYPDGELTEQQLDALRSEPLLVVVEGVQEDALQDANDNSELIQEMGDTIAALEHELEQARAGLKTASADVVRILAMQSAAPAQIVQALALLERADPAAEGVICVMPDALQELIREHLQLHALEAQGDGSESTLDGARDPQPPQDPAQVPPVASTAGDQPEGVTTDKPAAKRGPKAEKKGAGE